jgi:glycosyltransferase involved in cell wall biosynthesis
MYPSEAFPGRGVFVREQVKGLCAIGLEVSVVFVERRQEGPMAYYRMQNTIRNAVGGFDPDAIHVMYGGVMADQIARRQYVRPLVVTFHGSDLLGENLSGWARKIISRYGVYCSRRAAKAADGVVVVARHLMRALNGTVSTDKVRLVPCGIDLDRFKPMDPFVCKQRLGWNTRSFHVLFASSNGDPVKRPWLAKEAVAQVSKSDRPPELHFLTGISNAEVPVWLNASDALLLTSMHEGSPTVVKEALACGLPVVSVEVGDVAERIVGIEGCHLARPEPADLAAKLCLVRRRDRRLDCGEWLKELSILTAAQKLKRCYEEITCERRAARGFASPDCTSIPTVSSVNQVAASARQ